MAHIQYRLASNDTGGQTLVAYVNGQLTDPIDQTHPNFTAIVAACVAPEEVDESEFLALFDVASAITEKFQRLSERVTVKGNQVLFDGDPVGGPLEDQILEFLNQGLDFKPLVSFYDKLHTNPLGNVREGLYSWVAGQKVNGNFTIDADGDVIGYKSVQRTQPEWRTDFGEVFVPSRRSYSSDILNGQEVKNGMFIEQVPGDVVEMPRSRVLNAPSQECGDGLHIGTFTYAETFYGGNTVMAVKFSPRDIVSLPDGNSSWKLRVRKYTVLGIVDKPYENPYFVSEAEPEPETPSVMIDDQLFEPYGRESAVVTAYDADTERYDLDWEISGTLSYSVDELNYQRVQPIPTHEVGVGNVITYTDGSNATVDAVANDGKVLILSDTLTTDTGRYRVIHVDDLTSKHKVTPADPF